jgi:hypothetical protein
MLGFGPGNTLVKFAEDVVPGGDLPVRELRLALGKGVKPPSGGDGGGDGGGWRVVHED